MKYRILLFSSQLTSATVFAQVPAKQLTIKAETDMQLSQATTPVLANEGMDLRLTEDEGLILFSEDSAFFE